MAETNAEIKEEKKKKKKKNRFAFPLGLLVTVFALIGVVFTVSYAFSAVRDLLNNTERKAEYGDFLVPLVCNDPDPFDDISKADMAQLIDCAIWANIENDPEPSRFLYSETEFGYIMPEADVESSFAVLFGSEVKPLHQSIETGAYEFRYSPELKSYIIPSTGIDPVYVPRVTDIDRTGDSVVLTVDYLRKGDPQQDNRGNPIEPQASKVMVVKLRSGGGDTYYISALQTVKKSDTSAFSEITTAQATTEVLTTAAPTAPETATSAQVTTTGG